MNVGISEWFRMGHFVTSDLIRRLSRMPKV